MLFCNCAIDTRWNLPTPLIIRFQQKNKIKFLSLTLKMHSGHNEKSVAGITKESKFTLQSFYNITHHMSPTPIGCFLSRYIKFIFLLLLFLQEELIMRNQMQAQHLLKKILWLRKYYGYFYRSSWVFLN